MVKNGKKGLQMTSVKNVGEIFQDAQIVTYIFLKLFLLSWRERNNFTANAKRLKRKTPYQKDGFCCS